MTSLRAILRLYWQHYPGWFLWGLIMALVASLAGIGLLATAGWYLGATAMAAASAAGGTIVFNTVYPGFLIRVAALTRTFGRYGERLVTHDATFRFLARLRLGVFDGISRLSFRRLRDFRSGELLARLTADIDALDGLYLRVVLPLVSAFAATLIVIFALHLLDTALAACVGVLLIGMLILLPWQAARIGVALGRRIAFTSEAIRLRMIDLVRGQAELIMAGRLGDQIDAITRAADRLHTLQDRLSRQDLLGRMLVSIISGAALVVALILGARAYETGEIDMPMLIGMLLAVVALGELFAPLRRGLLEIGKAVYSSQRILPLLAAPSDDKSKQSAANADTGPIHLELSRVDFAYSSQSERIFEDFSLSLRSGQSIAIIGGSGAGKSTLLGLLSGLLDPLTGRIRCEYEDGRMAHLAPRIGLLTQRTELFRESLGFNLRIAAPDASEATLLEALDDAQLSDMLARMPSGLEAPLGDDGLGLSGGESRRLALARLLLFRPDLWLLDEPTEGLDGATAKSVLATLKEATRGKALVVVSHKRAEIELANQLLVLSEDQAPRVIDRSETQAWDTALATLR